MKIPDPNSYKGTDSERINAAIRDAAIQGGVVRISRRKPDSVSKRDYWLLDSAILIPGDTTLVISNCRIKLSDQSRDNWIRSANCIPGDKPVEWISNVHIVGEGSAVLEGADNPRATGDSAKNLELDNFGPPVIVNGKVIRGTYGTDAGKEGEEQHGDWRNIGILLARVRHFSIWNLRLVGSHAWAISLEYCREGLVRDLRFESEQYPKINGRQVTVLNRDGLDLRNGCRDITIENITGFTGDDLVALTAIGGTKTRPAGIFGSTHFCGPDPDLREQDVFGISLRNIRGYSTAQCMVVRFLNQNGVRMHGIQLSGVQDTSPAGHYLHAAVKIGDVNYLGSAKPGETWNFQINQVSTQAHRAILFGSPLSDSTISDVLYFRDRESHRLVDHVGPEHVLENVFFSNCQTIDRIN
jgi:hypothetical protein